MTDEFEEERARDHCSAMKDEVLRTQRWRNRFYLPKVDTLERSFRACIPEK
ncbi:hypothetical protein [Halopiger xanaduensis]|nr:hypothetical protein [Halopiger xanaduensis]